MFIYENYFLVKLVANQIIYNPDKPTKAYTHEAIPPKIKVTRLMSQRDSPQFKPPTITRTKAIQSITDNLFNSHTSYPCTDYTTISYAMRQNVDYLVRR